MDDKHIHPAYYYSGLLFLSMAVIGLVAGRTLSFAEDEYWLLTFATHSAQPIEFYAMTVLYALAAVVLIYKSLLFIGINREDLIARDGFDRRVVGLETPVKGVSIIRVLKIVFFSLLIAAAVYSVYFKSETISNWLIDKPEEPKIQRPEKIDCFNPPGRCL